MNKQTLQVFSIIIVILTLFSFSCVVSQENQDYSIPFVEKIISIQPDGSVNITEDFNYTIRATPFDIYRDIMLKDNQEISNISVETPRLYNDYTITNTSNGTRIKVSLYSDAQKTQPVLNQSANIVYHYKYTKGINLYNDIAEFNYTPWEEGWSVDVVRMTTYIKVPGNSSSVEKWANPSYYLSSDSWITPNTLQSRFRTIESNKTAQQVLLIPRSQFNSTLNANVINSDGKNIIEQQQEEYQNTLNYNYMITYLVCVISIILLLTPIRIYNKYGKKPEIEYEKSYTKDIPSNDSLVFVNAFINKTNCKINMDGFYATILDLIDKNYLDVITISDESIVFRISDKNHSNLSSYEKDIITYLSKFESDGEILINKTNVEGSFKEFIRNWKINAQKTLDYIKINGLFQNKCNFLFKIYSIITGIYVIGSLSYVLSLNPAVPTINWAFRATIILIPVIILMIFLSIKMPRKWTIEGKDFYNKWKQFELYITEYSLIIQHPPKSIEIWNKYIIYATTLGDIRTVNNNMNLYFKKENISNIKASDYIKIYTVLSSILK